MFCTCGCLKVNWQRELVPGNHFVIYMFEQTNSDSTEQKYHRQTYMKFKEDNDLKVTFKWQTKVQVKLTPRTET